MPARARAVQCFVQPAPLKEDMVTSYQDGEASVLVRRCGLNTRSVSVDEESVRIKGDVMFTLDRL